MAGEPGGRTVAGLIRCHESGATWCRSEDEVFADLAPLCTYPGYGLNAVVVDVDRVVT